MMAELISWRRMTATAQAIVFVLALCFMGFAAPAANAVLVHEWQFNDGTANDSAAGGSADGTLNGNASIVGGSLVLDGTAGTYVDLPASTIAINTYPAITIEAWATPSPIMGTLNQFTALLAFGQVNTTDSTALANYLLLQTHRGDNVSRAAIAISDDADPFTEEDFANGPEYNDGGKHLYSAVVTNTAISLYTDGQLRQTATVPVNGANNMISGISTALAQIGAGYPADPLYTGTVGNIRLYNNAQSALQILLSYNAGEPGPPGPKLTIDRTTGTMTLSNSTTLSANVVGYSISSAAGSLDNAAWTSIADNSDANNGGSFDGDDEWTKLTAAGSKTDYSEFVFDTTPGDGGAFGAGGTTSLQIGANGAWRKSIYQDLAVEMRLADGTDLPVEIVYTGGINNMPYIRSDLDFSGSVDIADWNIFLASAGASFSSMSAAESYPFGDLNGDLVSDRLDFRLFKADYIAANPGAGAWEALIGGNVPEPSTLALLMLSCIGFLACRSRGGQATSRPRMFSQGGLATIVAVLAALIALPASADVVHRYGFNEGVTADASGRTIVDSVAGANGVIRGAGSSATASQLSLAGGPSDTAAYVDLPNGIVSALTDATFEAWYTIAPDPATIDPGPPASFSWGRVWDFGSTDAPDTNGELTGPGGGGNGQDNLFYAPNRGTNIAQQRFTIANQDPLFLGSDGGDSATGVYNDYDPEFVHQFNTLTHVALVFDADGGGPGMATMTPYINGARLDDADGQPNPFPVNYQLANLNDVNNWLGRSNWTVDQNFAGSFEEFRIYDSALAPTDVATDYICGPDLLCANAVSLKVDTGNGQVSLVNNLDVALPIEYYELTSEGGALNTAGWTSIDGDGPAPGEGWDKSGAADVNKLLELYLPEGGTDLPANGEISIGAAFNPFMFGIGNDGDLQFSLGHTAGAVLTGSVDYIFTEPGDVAGDYNGDGTVNAADYTLWRNHLGESFTLANEGGISPGVVDQDDYNFWKSRFGATSGSGAGAGSVAVPESATMVSLASALLGLAVVGRRRATTRSRLVALVGAADFHQHSDRRHSMPTHIGIGSWSRPFVALLVAMLVATSGYASTPDRFYQFGDDPTEQPSLGQPPLSDFGQFTGDSQGTTTDFQDLQPVGGGPLYVHTDATGRPGAAAGEWGLEFNGTSDLLVRLGGGLGSPEIGDDEASYSGVTDYTGITTRLMDLWVRPTDAALGRQDVVNDTAQFGIFVSDDDQWGFVEGTTTVTSTTPVAFNAWTHVMHRTFTNDAAVLYVDGVAVAATQNNYNTAAVAGNIVFGASEDQSTNFFKGDLDNATISVAGDNSNLALGADWGDVDLATDNDYIRQQLIGKPAGDVNLDGTLDSNDVTAFVAGWLHTKQVNGVTTGDVVTRMMGDFDFSGTVDIDDAFTLHQALIGAGAGGLDFSLLGASVPEPSSIVLALCSLAGLASRLGRHRRQSVGKSDLPA